MTELKPCPFCGGKATLNSGYDEGNGYSASSGGWWASVGCPECEIDKLTCEESAEEMAVDMVTLWWNARHKPTCENLSLNWKWLMCSHCGAFTQVTDCTDVLGARYCGYCGSRVVRGDAS